MSASLPIAARAAALIEWTGPWFAVLTLLADLAKEKGLTRDQVHFAVDFVLDDDMPASSQEGLGRARCDVLSTFEECVVETLSVPPGGK